MAYYLYMVRCRDASIYAGIAEDVAYRVWEHNAGKIDGCYTQPRRPVQLIYTEEYADRDQAFRRERQLKGWSRAKKEALVKGDLERLRWLSRSYTERLSVHSLRRLD
jgi:predicted GIY-YIG superfamily endonuclease